MCIRDRLATVGEVVLADTASPVALAETGLPLRWYVPPGDVRMELLEPSDTTSVCPFKGTASYWSARLPDGTVVPDVAWGYLDPIPACEAIRGHLCFYDDKASVAVS